MTPLHLEILMHHHVSPAPFRALTETIEQYRQDLIDKGLLEFGENANCYATTDKGKAWIERALSTPMPVQKWVWEP